MRHLLHDVVDHQVIDANGEHCGRVDDVVFDDADRPRLVAIVVGMGSRRRSRVARAVHRLSQWCWHAVGGRGTLDPVCVPWAKVGSADGGAVRLLEPAGALGLQRLEQQAARIVGRIPGAR